MFNFNNFFIPTTYSDYFVWTFWSSFNEIQLINYFYQKVIEVCWGKEKLGYSVFEFTIFRAKNVCFLTRFFHFWSYLNVCGLTDQIRIFQMLVYTL